MSELIYSFLQITFKYEIQDCNLYSKLKSLQQDTPKPILSNITLLTKLHHPKHLSTHFEMAMELIRIRRETQIKSYIINTLIFYISGIGFGI